MNELIYHFFDDDEFLRISNAIKNAELITSGEIKVSIKERRSFTERNLSLRALAEKEFYNLDMHLTRDKTGVLLLFILNDRQFYILADEGIVSKVEQSVWDSVSNEIQNNFSKGYFSEGIIKGIEKISHVLEEYFPIKPDDENELTNKVILPVRKN